MARAIRLLVRIPVLAAFTCVAGCFTIGQDYKRPAIDVPTSWRIDNNDLVLLTPRGLSWRFDQEM